MSIRPEERSDNLCEMGHLSKPLQANQAGGAAQPLRARISGVALLSAASQRVGHSVLFFVFLHGVMLSEASTLKSSRRDLLWHEFVARNPAHRLVSGPFTRVAYALTKRKIGRVV